MPRAVFGHDGGVTETDRAGRSPLHYAALQGDAEAVDRLASAGADVDGQDQDGRTALHFAVQQGQVEAAAALLAAQARVDIEDRYGNEPLWTATFNARGDGRLIRMLLAHGADVHHRNRAGASPLALARRISNYPVATFFDEIDRA